MEVDAADWMMALVRGVDALGERVAGFSCEMGPAGAVQVTDPGSGARWTVRPVTASSTSPLAEPPRHVPIGVTPGPMPDRLMTPVRQGWRTGLPRPLWEPDGALRSAGPGDDPRHRPPPNLRESLFEHAEAIRRSDSLETACAIALSRVLALVSAEGGSVLLSGETEDGLVVRAVQGGAGEALMGKTIPTGVGVAGAACEGGVVLVVRDVRSDPRHFQGFDQATGFETRGLLAAPVRTESGLYGVLEVVNPHGEAGFEPWHVDVVELLAGALARRLSGRV